MKQLRLNAADDPVAGEPERITEDETEYLRVPVVSSREQIYEYPDQRDAYNREYLPGEELSDAVERTNSIPVVVDHPVEITPRGPRTTSIDAADNIVGQYRNLRTNADGTKALGDLYLEVDERDENGDRYRDAFDDLEDGGEVPVSLGYRDLDIDVSTGRFNGQQYDAIQRNPTLDHLGVIVSPGMTARCTPDGGCAAGRANAAVTADPGAAIGTPLTQGESNDMSQSTSDSSGAPTRTNARSEARTPEFDDTLSEAALENRRENNPHESHTFWGIGEYLNAYEEATGETFEGDPYSALSSIPDDAREWIAGHTLLGNADATSEENLMLFNVVSPEGELYETKLDDVLGQDGAEATLPQQTRESARAETRSLLSEEFGRDFGDDSGRENARSTPRTPEYTGTTTGEWNAPSLSDYINAFAESADQDATQVSELSQASKSAIAKRTLLGEVNASTADDLRSFPVVTTDDTLHESALDAVLSRAPQAEYLTEDEAAALQGKARSLLREEFDRDLSEERENALQRAYHALGSVLPGGSGRANGTAPDDAADTAGADSGSTTTESRSQDTDMTDPDNPNDDEMIDYLADETDFDRENAEKLRGEDCLELTYERFNAEAETDAGNGDSTTETSETTDSPTDPGEDDDSDEAEGGDEGDESITFDSREEFDEAVQEAVESRENAQEEESLIELIDERSERYNAEMLEGTPNGVLQGIADEVTDDARSDGEFGGQQGPNAPGSAGGQADRSPMRTGGPMRANAGEDTPDAAVGGDPWSDSRENAEQEADD